MNEPMAAVADDVIGRWFAHHPFDATLSGVRDHDDAVPDLSEASRRQQREEIAALRRRLEEASRDQADEVTPRVASHVLDGWEAELDARWEDFSVSGHFGGAHVSVLETMPKVTLVEPDHVSDYLARAAAVPGYLDQAISRLRAGVTDGLTPPRRGVVAAIGQVDAYLATDADDDPLLVPVRENGDERLRELAVLVRTGIRPALARYRAALAEEITPAGRPDDDSGLVNLPGGDERYRRALAHHTTSSLTPEEIHALGWSIIEELEDEYRELGGRVLGTDDVAEVFARLRDDPALRFDTADEVEQAAEDALRRAEEAVPDWFGRLPAARCEVRIVPMAEAPDTTIAYYLPPAEDGSRPGLYFVNTYEPHTRTRFEAEVLAFHESVPGHHLQLAIQQELELPRLRRLAFVTAYAEGWALYTERLCDEMGLYRNDLSRLGLLSFDSWRACRLVVDTGIHAFGWSRQRAIDHLLEHSPQARNNIANEVDRYIGWPGQACAYMVGRREIQRVRDLARARQGPRFDIRAFHDAVLGVGAVPLDVLADVVEGWTGAG